MAAIAAFAAGAAWERRDHVCRCGRFSATAPRIESARLRTK
jgi:hypothetical protein